MAKLIDMVLGSPGYHYFFFLGHAVRAASIWCQKTNSFPHFVIRQIEALDELNKTAYKDFFNGSVLGRNLVVFLA